MSVRNVRKYPFRILPLRLRNSARDRNPLTGSFTGTLTAERRGYVRLARAVASGLFVSLGISLLFVVVVLVTAGVSLILLLLLLQLIG